MNRVHVLDCTLRDGGYCNQWRFGFENEKKITQSLVDANVDIIECGFVTNEIEYDKDSTRFSGISDISGIIPNDRRNKLFVAMINYGEYCLEDIPMCDHSSVDGIRVAFHKKDYLEAIEFCKGIQEKGYQLFIQAMVSLSYSDKEFLELIRLVSEICPYACDIVYSFGMMKGKDLVRLYYMVEHNLNDEIWIGFHSHNNMQLSYSNAQTLVGLQTNRDLIIDSSIYGMGRGAGNLNTELFVEYLNDNLDSNYDLKPLLLVIDEVLEKFHNEHYWGYSLSNYLSAKYNTHPNYAVYLDEKKTLTVENMDDIFSMMDDDKRINYDEDYIERVYEEYMASDDVQGERLSDVQLAISGKDVLIIAPGKSSSIDKDKIIGIMESDDVVSISINAEYKHKATDYIFLSNLRRYRDLDVSKHEKCIVTSNIPATDMYLKVRYSELTNQYELVRDNAGLMAIKFVMSLGAKRVLLAGMDGYSMNSQENYADKSMEFFAERANLESMNEGVSRCITKFSESISITFVTEPKYVDFSEVKYE